MNGPQEPQVPVWQRWLDDNKEGTLEGLFRIFLRALDAQFGAYRSEFDSKPGFFYHSCAADGLSAHAKAITNELFLATTEFVKKEAEEKKKQEAEPDNKKDLPPASSGAEMPEVKKPKEEKEEKK